MPDFTPFIVAGLCTGAVYVLSGVGLVVLYRASGVLNFAQGAIGAFAALTAWTLVDAGLPVWLGWSGGVVAAALLSLLYGRLVAPSLATADPTVRAVATLGFALIVLGALEFFWGEWPRSLRLPIDTMGIQIGGVRVTYSRGLAFILALAVTLGVMLFLAKSRLGLSMRALANDRDIAALVGVPVTGVDAWAWLLSGVLAGVSGLMLANLVRLQASILTFMVIPAMAAAIVGRLRSLPLTVAGGLAIGVAESVATPFAQLAPYRSAAPFLVAVAALLFMQWRGASEGRVDQAVTARVVGPRSRQGSREIAIGVAVAVLVAIVLPGFASAYWLKSLTSVLILGIAALSVSLLYAEVGIVSLCQYALVGVGGWVTLRIAHATGQPFTLSLLEGAVAAALFGVLAGLPALRLRGLYVALMTLMIAGAFQTVITVFGFPDGGAGFFGRVVGGGQIPLPRPGFAQDDAAYFRYVLIATVACFLLVQAHRASRAGRAWALIRRGEAGAISLGVPIVAYKVWAFALAGLLAGLAGGLMAGSVGFLDASSFPAADSILLFALAVVAGAYHWSGPLFAGLLMRAFPSLLLDLGVDGNLASVIYGAGLLHSLIAAPEGMSGQAAALAGKVSGLLRRRKQAAAA
jgi:branched-chain amino acid transport system permease protein